MGSVDRGIILWCLPAFFGVSPLAVWEQGGTSRQRKNAGVPVCSAGAREASGCSGEMETSRLPAQILSLSPEALWVSSRVPVCLGGSSALFPSG